MEPVTLITPAQLRALQREFRRRHYDRQERLAAATAVLGLDQPLGSFSDLRTGQAGCLLGWLRSDASWDDPVPEARPGPEIDHGVIDFGRGPEPVAEHPHAAAAAAAGAAAVVVMAVPLVPLIREAYVFVNELVLALAAAVRPAAASAEG